MDCLHAILLCSLIIFGMSDGMAPQITKNMVLSGEVKVYEQIKGLLAVA